MGHFTTRHLTHSKHEVNPPLPAFIFRGMEYWSLMLIADGHAIVRAITMASGIRHGKYEAVVVVLINQSN